MRKEKISVLVRLEKDLVNYCDNSLDIANARSRNELIRDAVRFYLYYLHREEYGEYLAPSVKRIMNRCMNKTEDRIAEAIYQLAVEQGIMNQLLAENLDYDDEALNGLREHCIQEVNRINGLYHL